jgi:hypothetical protein
LTPDAFGDYCRLRRHSAFITPASMPRYATPFSLPPIDYCFRFRLPIRFTPLRHYMISFSDFHYAIDSFIIDTASPFHYACRCCRHIR